MLKLTGVAAGIGSLAGCNSPTDSGTHRSTKIRQQQQISEQIADEQRLRAVYEANQIRAQAGVPNSEPTGPRESKRPGLQSESDLRTSSKIRIRTKQDAEKLADKGSGTRANPFVIKDRLIRGKDGESVGFKWSDSTADYHIELRNVAIHGWQKEQIRMDAPAELHISNAILFSGTPSRCVLQSKGVVKLHEVQLGGCGSHAIVGSNGTLLEMRDVMVDQSKHRYRGDAIRIGKVEEVNVQYTEITAPSVKSALRVMGPGDVHVTWQNSKVKGVQEWGFILGAKADGTLEAGSTFKYIDIEGTGKDCFKAANCTEGDYEIAYSRFAESANGYRLILLDRHAPTGTGYAKGWDIHHCKGTKSTGEKKAGNEGFETWHGWDVTFRDCWITECTEDAYEHAYAVANANIERCVADNTNGEAVDYYRVGPRPEELKQNRSIDSEVHHIYGDCQKNALAIASVDNLLIHDIYVETAGNAVSLGTSDGTGTPDGCEVYGPLPRPESVGGELLTISDQAGENTAVYYDGEGLITIGNPPQGRSKIR